MILAAATLASGAAILTALLSVLLILICLI